MASRAEPRAARRAVPSRAPGDLPIALSIGSAIRAAAQDGYYHSWRLLPANVVWSVVAIAIAGATVVTPPAIVVLPLLAMPTAGIFRITTRITRGEAVSFWDAVDAWRTDVLTTVGIGAGFVLAVVILGSNVVSGLTSDSPLGWGLATLAGWGLLATWLFAWTLWPILVDPTRSDQPVIARLRLAALLVLAHPVRIGLLAAVLALILVVSTIAIVALITVAVAFSALIASRYVLPAADRLEARAGAAARLAPMPSSVAGQGPP